MCTGKKGSFKSVVTTDFYTKTGAWIDDEKVLSSCSLNPNYRQVLSTPSGVRRVDSKPPVFSDGTNDGLFDRLETVRFFRLFTGEGEVIQNPEAERLEYCPDCHLTQISLRRGAYDGSLEGLVITRVWAKMLSCKLLSTTAAFVLYILWC